MPYSYFRNGKKIDGSTIPFKGRAKAAREYAGYSQEGLADKASTNDKNLSPALIQKIEQGKKPLTERAARIIADLCGVRFEWLIDPKEQFMTQDELDRHNAIRDLELQRYNTMREIEQSFTEYNERVRVALSDGYYFIMWLVLQKLRDEYEILPTNDSSFTISKNASSITIDGTEIKEDLFDYAEFRLRKLIKNKLNEPELPLREAKLFSDLRQKPSSANSSEDDLS